MDWQDTLPILLIVIANEIESVEMVPWLKLPSTNRTRYEHSLLVLQEYDAPWDWSEEHTILEQSSIL